MTTIAFLLLSAVTKTTPIVNKTSAESVLQSLSQKVNFPLFVADSAAIGYTLREVEATEIKGQTVVRMHYVNAKAMNSFDLVESASMPQVSADEDLKTVLSANVFPISVGEEDTVVCIKKAKTDVMFVGSQLSVPSAKKMVERTFAYRS